MFSADQKIPLSDECCAMIQNVNVSCLCSKVDENVVCMDKLVSVADYCKKPLEPDSKCGSKFSTQIIEVVKKYIRLLDLCICMLPTILRYSFLSRVCFFSAYTVPICGQ
jgi:hypothetical protein